VLATTAAVQAAFDAGGLLAPLLTVAVGGLLLVFGLWWSYFKRDPGIGHHLSLRTMLGWGYGHYFVFAAVAALGAGLQVAAETTHSAADLTAPLAAATVAVPVAIYLVAIGLLHARRISAQALAPIVATVLLLLLAAGAAGWIGVPLAVLAMGLLVAALVAVMVATLQREIA
jgi:low temperature requirement protein LtrA